MGGRERRLSRFGVRGGMLDTGFAQQLQEWKLLRQEPQGRHPLRGGALPAHERPGGRTEDPDSDRIDVLAFVVVTLRDRPPPVLFSAGTFQRLCGGAHRKRSGGACPTARSGPVYYDEANVDDSYSRPLLRLSLLKVEDNRLGNDACVRLRGARPRGWRQGRGCGGLPAEWRYIDPVLLDASLPDADPSKRRLLGGPATCSCRLQPECGVVYRAIRAGNPDGGLFQGAPVVEARGADDIEVFVLIQIRDAHGNACSSVFTECPPERDDITSSPTDGATILRYKVRREAVCLGPSSRQDVVDQRRASPQLRHASSVLVPGEIVDLGIDLMPIGLAFHPGEQLLFGDQRHNFWER